MEEKYIPADGRWIMENSGVFVDIEIDMSASDGSITYVWINGKKYSGNVNYMEVGTHFQFEIDENIGLDIIESIVYLKIKKKNEEGYNYILPEKFVSYPKKFPTQNIPMVMVNLKCKYLDDNMIVFIFSTDKFKAFENPS